MKEMFAYDKYVQITREEFEEWLDTTEFRGKWQVKSGTVGVYQLKLSDNVAIEISSSIGSQDSAMGHGQASIQLRLVSLITGYTLNKVAQGQSHFKRTMGWRDTIKKAVDKFKDVYVRSATFYEAVSEIKDRDKYKKDLIQRIESYALWKNNPVLVEFYTKISQGGILTKKQVELLEKMVREEQQTVVEHDEELLNRIRKLWLTTKDNGDKWMMDFAESIGKQYKSRGQLSDKQMAILEKALGKYKISSQITNIASEILKLAEEIVLE